MVPFDSACQIGLSTIRRDLLTIDQGVCRWRFKNCDFGNFFDYWRRTRQHTGKRTPAFDSANWIAVSTLLKEDLIPDQDVCRWRFKNCEIWYVFDCWRRTRQDTVKRTPPFDSAHQIGIFTPSTEILTIDQVVCGWGFKIVKSRTFLLALWEPVERYGETDETFRFSVSNGCIYPLEGGSDCRSRCL